MSDTFRTHQLPGSLHSVPVDQVCDTHGDRQATRRVQGETDSFGCEVADMCDECFAEYRKALAESDTSGVCDWCKCHAEKLRHARDYDEGMAGPVYDVCLPCIRKRDEEARRELERMDRECGG